MIFKYLDKKKPEISNDHIKRSEGIYQPERERESYNTMSRVQNYTIMKDLRPYTWRIKV